MKPEISFWLSENRDAIITSIICFLVVMLFLAANLASTQSNLSAVVTSRTYKGSWLGNKEVTIATLESGGSVKFGGSNVPTLKNGQEVCLLKIKNYLGTTNYKFTGLGKCT